MIRSTLNCLRRVRFGASSWWADVEHMPVAWRKAVANAFAAPLVGSVMQRLDKNGDGIVTIDEFTEYFDKDGDGVVTLNEFKAFFDAYDADGDGLVSLEEFQQAARGGWFDSHANRLKAHDPTVTNSVTEPPTQQQLDSIAEIAQAAQDAGTPYNIVRETWTVLPRATIHEARAMREAILRINYFPTRKHAPSRKSKNSHFDGGDQDPARSVPPLQKILNAHGHRSVLAVPVWGSWSDRTQTVTTPSGTANVPATASVGDLFLQLVQVAPGVPFFQNFSMLVLDQVLHMYDSDGAAGFTVATTPFHDEIGTHTAVLRWRRIDTDTCENASSSTESASPEVPDPVRDSVKCLGEPDCFESEDGARYCVTLDVAAATAFQPHISMNPIAVRLGCALAARSHRLSVEHFRAVAAAATAADAWD